MSKIKTKVFWPRFFDNLQHWGWDFLKTLDAEWYQLTNYLNTHYHTDNIHSPDSVTVNTGSPAGGVNVSQVTSFLDGNVYQVTEATGVPGFDVEFAFSEILSFTNINMRLCYDGSTSHFVGVDAYDYVASAWKQLSLAPHTDVYFTWLNIRVPEDNNFVSTTGAVKIRLYHYTSGDAAHELYIDYVALTQTAYSSKNV